MPFLTDRLQETERADRLARALADENVTTVPRPTAAAGNSRFTFDLSHIESELRGAIVGQDDTIDEILELLTVVRADIGDPRRPLVSVLLAGPTGVGKTETVRTVARALYGDADAVCRIDMNTLAQEHYAASFTGAPPGYVGSKEGTTILDQDKIEGSRALPGIVLFDELEKASTEVALALLNVLDNGILTVASGERTYSFRNALIFMTTNLGARELMALSRPRRLPRLRGGSDRDRARDLILNRLLARFPPEFVNRIDHVATLNPIRPQTMPLLVDVELDRVNRRLRKHNVKIVLEDAVRAFLSHSGYDSLFGARGLRRAIRRHLEFPLAAYLLSDKGTSRADGAVLRAVMQGSDIAFVEAEKGTEARDKG